MGAEANTDKPHSHHAILKDIPDDKSLKNEAAPGVCAPLNECFLDANNARFHTSHQSKTRRLELLLV